MTIKVLTNQTNQKSQRNKQMVLITQDQLQHQMLIPKIIRKLLLMLDKIIKQMGKEI